MQVKPIVVHALKTNFSNASASFCEKQNADNWAAVEDAMWALQFANQRSEEELKTLTETWSIGNFPELFTKAAKAKVNG